MNTVLGLDPTVTLIANTELFLLIFLIVVYAMAAPRKIVLGTLYAIAVLHIIFIAAYAHTYSLSLRVRPLLDIFVDPRDAHASAMLDIAQLSIIIIVIEQIISRRRSYYKDQVTNITPSSTQEQHP